MKESVRGEVKNEGGKLRDTDMMDIEEIRQEEEDERGKRDGVTYSFMILALFFDFVRSPVKASPSPIRVKNSSLNSVQCMR